MICKTAIVVEDDPFWMSEIRETLEEEGVSVIGTESVDDAIVHARAVPEACIILDIILPERDGIEFINHAQEAQPNSRILAISGGGRLGAEFYLKLATALGALESLEKPFTREQLKAKWRVLAG